MKPIIRLPTVIEFYDFHEINDFGNKLKYFLIPNIKWREIRIYDQARYRAIFYISENKEYERLLDRFEQDEDMNFNG